MFRGKPQGGRSSYNGGRGGAHGLSNGRLRGLFEKGEWKCDCTPREPATHFQVKKESANKGRWFYTCQKAEPDRCGFFLWDEDAKPRMEAAVLSNSTTEPTPQRQQRTHNNASRAPVSPPSPPIKDNGSPVQNSPETLKRKLPWLNDRNGAGEGPSRAERAAQSHNRNEVDEDQHRRGLQRESELTHERIANRQFPPVTPRKARQTDAAESPSNAGRSQEANGLLSPDNTPSKGRTAANLSPSALPSPTTKFSSLLAETMETLAAHNIKLPTAAVDELQALYDRREMQTHGIVKGRQIARLAVLSRDEQIADLTQRIGVLEGQVESSRAVIRHLRAEAATAAAAARP